MIFNGLSPDYREEHQCAEELRARRKEHDRNTPAEERECENARQPAAAQRRRHDRSDHATGSDCRSERTDGAAGAVQKLEGRHHDQHVQAATDERLGDHQSHDDGCAGMLSHRAPGKTQAAGRGSPTRRRPFRVNSEDEADADGQGRRREGEGGADAHLLDEHARDQRPDQRSDALDGGRGGVRRDQLLRRRSQRRE